MENYAEIFGNIMQKKVTIMRNLRCQIMRKFLTSYGEFSSFMTCLNLAFAAIRGQVFLRSTQFFQVSITQE